MGSFRVAIYCERMLYYGDTYSANFRLRIYMELGHALWMVVKFEGRGMHGFAQRYADAC